MEWERTVKKYPLAAIVNTIPKDFKHLLGIKHQDKFELRIDIAPSQPGNVIGIAVTSIYAFVENSTGEALAELHLKIAYEMPVVSDTSKRDDQLTVLVNDAIADINKMLSRIESPLIKGKQQAVLYKESISQKTKIAFSDRLGFN